MPVFRGFQVIARCLTEASVTHVFAMLGAGGAGWIGYGESQELFDYVGVRHEAAAVTAAAGFARAAGTVGVCSVNCGPGLANALGALTAAVRDRSPVVVLVSEVPADSRYNRAQIIDQVRLVAPTGAAVRRVTDPDDLVVAIHDALRSAERDQLPQVITFAEELIEAAVPSPTRPGTEHDAFVEPDRRSIEIAVDLLDAATDPLVLAGRGVMLAGCAREVAQLADDAGALLTTTLPDHHLFAGDPFAIGFTGGWATPSTRRLVNESDCVLALGASLSSYTVNGGDLFPDATVIQCDRDPEAIAGFRPVDHAVIGHAASVVSGLRAEIARRPARVRTRRTPDCARRLADERFYRPAEDLSNERGLDPRAVLHRLDTLLPADRIVVSDVGRWSALLPGLLPVADPRSLVLTLGFASIGHGLGAAIGAAHAAPNRPVVLVAGDGGFLMAAQELGAVQRAGIPLTVVVIDDEQFGAEVPALAQLGLAPRTAGFPGPDYVHLARAYGGDGLVVRTADELAALSVREVCRDGLTILDVKVDPAINARQFLRDDPDPWAN